MILQEYLGECKFSACPSVLSVFGFDAAIYVISLPLCPPESNSQTQIIVDHVVGYVLKF